VRREAFLDRLRDARAGAPGLAGAHPPGPPPALVPRVAWRPNARGLEERFADALAGVRARLVAADALPAALAELEVRTAVATTDLVALPGGVTRLGLERVGEADAGVTAARAACAATGTVVLESSPEQPRLVSLLPRVHVAAVPRSSLVETPGEVLRGLGGGPLPSALTLASGPSRSADIDGEVVYGVHGPLAVLVVLVEA
jgi:L-lactate dehydrogenase complex protein LldG